MIARCAAVILASLPGSGIAETVSGCDPAALQGQAFTACLSEAEKASAAALEGAVQSALTFIATTPDVYDTQRTRWRNLLIES